MPRSSGSRRWPSRPRCWASTAQPPRARRVAARARRPARARARPAGPAGTAAERARIAREMHDIVAHNLVGHDRARRRRRLRDRATDPERAKHAMQTRRAPAARRYGDAAPARRAARGRRHARLAPQPGLDAARRAASRGPRGRDCRSATGDRHAGAAGRGLQLAVYRIVQEALTNTLKHAGPGATRGRGAPALRATTARARDRRRRRRPAHAAAGGGRGPAGMRERAAVYGGRARRRPARGGGWQVALVVPLAAAVPA